MGSGAITRVGVGMLSSAPRPSVKLGWNRVGVAEADKAEDSCCRAKVLCIGERGGLQESPTSSGPLLS